MRTAHGIDRASEPRAVRGRMAWGGCLRGSAAALLVMAALSGGCGYKGGFGESSLYPSNIRSVYVEMFQSKEFRRGIEFQLTEALRKEIDRGTPYVNAPRAKADTILTGEVLEWREAALGRDFVTNLPRESSGTLAIRYRWQDMRTGKLLVEMPRLETTIQYVEPTGETTYMARDDAVVKLARKVRESMESPW